MLLSQLTGRRKALMGTIGFVMEKTVSLGPRGRGANYLLSGIWPVNDQGWGRDLGIMGRGWVGIEHGLALPKPPLLRRNRLCRGKLKYTAGVPLKSPLTV